MNIGFDAKRAYHNSTGLGFYSRVLIRLLATHYPKNEYFLFNPKPGHLFESNTVNVHEVRPKAVLHKLLSSAWRSKWVVSDLKKHHIQLYHGLSQEIPASISKTSIASIVTIHDLFAELYPQDFKPIDVKIYRAKLRNACENANKIMAISQETKKHIVEKYKISPDKIDVIYQSYSPLFSTIETHERKETVRAKYNLPPHFFLHVGTIIERKNLLNICKALRLVQAEIPIPLVVIGNGGAYKKKVKQYLQENQIQDQVIFLSEQLAAMGKTPFVQTEDLPALYQLSTALIYPSYYEGFGLPIIEAMSGGVPVITSTTSCLPEIGGNAAFYAHPDKPEEMADGFRRLYFDTAYRNQSIIQCVENAKRFAPEHYVQCVMKMYQSIL